MGGITMTWSEEQYVYVICEERDMADGDPGSPLAAYSSRQLADEAMSAEWGYGTEVVAVPLDKPVESHKVWEAIVAVFRPDRVRIESRVQRDEEAEGDAHISGFGVSAYARASSRVSAEDARAKAMELKRVTLEKNWERWPEKPDIDIFMREPTYVAAHDLE